MCASVVFPQFVLTPSSCRRVFVGRYLAHNGGRSAVVSAMRERRWPRAERRRASGGRERVNRAPLH